MIAYRLVGKNRERRALCVSCDRDASQTRISRYCLAAISGQPLLCDLCWENKVGVNEAFKAKLLKRMLTLKLTGKQRKTIEQSLAKAQA